eukprot:443607_1
MTSKSVIAKKRKLLIESASKYPNLGQLIEAVKKEPDDQFLTTFGFILDNLTILEMLSRYQMSMFNSPCIPHTLQSEPSLIRNRFDQAAKKNQEYFSENPPNDIINRIRDSFYELSRTNTSLFDIIHHSLTLSYADLDFCDEIIYGIESFVLDHEVNLIHLDIDTLCQYMLEKMEADAEWVVKNILEKDVIALDDPNGCFINGFIFDKLYSNNRNLRDMNRDGSYFENTNKELYGDSVNTGSIFVLISDTMHAGFSEVYYIYERMKLRKIGIKQYGSHYNNSHVIIPVHITRLLYDPIKAYAPFIHQHCFEYAGGTIELELQIDNKSHIFHPKYKTFSKQKEDEIIKHYSWSQEHISETRKQISVDKIKESIINDYNPFPFSTVYTITDVGRGALIGYCNHPHINKINLAQFEKNVDPENVGYILKYTEKTLSKNMPDKYAQLLISGFFREINADENGLYVGIVAMIQNFYKTRPLWNYDPGLRIRNNMITYVLRNFDVRQGGIDDDKLNWLQAVSTAEFASGIVKLMVNIKRDEGSIDIGIIESSKVETLNGWFEKCIEESIFAYNTVGKFYICGKASKKIDSKHMLYEGSKLLLKLDFNKNKLECWTKKSVESNWKRPKRLSIESNKTYKCFISMCWRRDCVYATYSKLAE